MLTATFNTNEIDNGDLLGMSDAEFAQYATTRAEAAGYHPALWQRGIDWTAVRGWAIHVRNAGFAWAAAGEYDTDAIVVGPAIGGGYAVHAGQHRILGGLAGGNPVPATSMTWVESADRIKNWDTETAPCGAGFTADDLLLALAL